jgi:hypothetical protein
MLSERQAEVELKFVPLRPPSGSAPHSSADEFARKDRAEVETFRGCTAMQACHSTTTTLVEALVPRACSCGGDNRARRGLLRPRQLATSLDVCLPNLTAQKTGRRTLQITFIRSLDNYSATIRMSLGARTISPDVFFREKRHLRKCNCLPVLALS